MNKSKMESEGIVSDIEVLKITGNFTSETTPMFQSVCRNVVANKSIKGVLLDFEGVRDIDTSAFACMVDFIKEHNRRNVKIGIINLKMHEEKLMDILRLSDFISTFNSVDEAVSKFKEDKTT